MAKPVLIIGAGLSGLLAASKFRQAQLIEDRLEANSSHKALLRFRDTSVSELTGIPFKPVTVYKEIWFEGAAHGRCSNAMANLYATKVTGKLQGRSIRDLSTVTRYVATDDFYERLIEAINHRIQWGHPLENAEHLRELTEAHDVISTMPMPSLLKLIGRGELTEQINFSYGPIRVERYRVPSADVYQTVYFPSPYTPIYRASITGDVLIIESVAVEDHGSMSDRVAKQFLRDVFEAFGLNFDDCIRIETANQRYGKIVPLDKEKRQAILHELTRDYGLYSIGRFACWNNLLLDDVVHDLTVVERMMKSSDYGRALLAAKET